MHLTPNRYNTCQSQQTATRQAENSDPLQTRFETEATVEGRSAFSVDRGVRPLLLAGLAFALGTTVATGVVQAAPIVGKFAPPEGSVLVFAGQDNESVGGTEKWNDGYVNNVQVPAGITHYVYFSEGWTNKFGKTFAKGSVAGLHAETEWAAGPMHLKAYVDSPLLQQCIMHVSISMEGNCEDQVADGSFDHLIGEFVRFIGDHPDRLFFIRIGYEFDGSWNGYDPANFKKAFRRIVNALREAHLKNFVIVFASSSSVTAQQFEEYDPGDQYYDWIGYSWWGGDKDGLPALEYARKVRKPVFVAEATPRGHFFNKEDPETVWDAWFKKFFHHIEKNIDVIRAVSYINADWDSQEMWDGWGQTRIETSPLIKRRWLAKMADPMYINAIDNPVQIVGFRPGVGAATQRLMPYLDASLPVRQRVDDLLGRMTIDEKVAQITGWWDPSEEKMREQGGVFEPDFYAKKCPNGIGELGPLHNLSIEEDARQYAAVQEYFRNRTRLGIPAILHDEAAHGFMKFEANSYPTPIGLSCTWNPELLVEIYSQTAQEARSRGVSHVLSPIVDVARDPRWGRVDETLGEDPFLVSRLGAAMVQGLQGSSDGTISSTHVAATLKHFAGYAGTEGGRNRSPYTHGPWHLLDTEVEPFRHIINAAKPAAVMAAFNEVAGVPCHVNPWVLTEVLRHRIGFQGLTVGDYQGIDLVRRYQKIGASDADAALMALNAGLQLELPNNFGFKHLPRLFGEGKVKIGQIDAAVRAVLELKFRLGLFEAPTSLDVVKAKALAHSPEATALAREAARQAIVLLKNEGDLLPLTPGDHRTVAVIGPNANVCRLGNYSGRPLKTVSLLEGIRTYLGNRAQVLHAEGCRIAHNDAGDSYANWRYVNEISFASLEDNRPLINKAVEVAEKSDLVLLALGENVLLSREAWGDNHVGDRTTFCLTESQQELAKKILAIGKPVVLILNNSKPVVLRDLGDRIPAILTLHYSGQETGTAAAEILFGETNPSGKLTLSWPRSVGHLPSHYSQQASAQVFDYVDSPQGPIYPFGYGLSYTSFQYGRPRLSAAEVRKGESVAVSFDITNTGKYLGTEIAQLYVSGESFAVARPAAELKGFTRVTLNPGETRTVMIRLDADDLHFHDTSLNRVLPDGKYEVRVGGSSSDLSEPLTLVTKAAASSAETEALKEKKTQLSEHPRPAIKRTVSEASARRAPNVLFIAIDDLRPELGTYGAKTITPNMDALAQAGIRFDRAYCQQAVCGASRLSIMGGLYPTMTGEQTFHVSGWRERHPNLLTMNQYFGSQGYQTIGLGKVYHGHTGNGIDKPNWTRWINLDAESYANPENVKILRQALERNKGGDSKDPPKGPLTESADVPDDTYLDGIRASKTAELLEELAAEDHRKPFFLAVGFSKPHLPFVAPKKYWNLYRREAFSMPGNQSIPPGYPSYAANLLAHEMRKYSDFEGDSPRDFSDALNRRLLHGYAAATSYVDACLGQVLTALDQSGLADNTIVVLWGDHGWKLGDHGTWVKHTNFECDTRVPLIIRDPRVRGGKSSNRLVELIDLYPTLCDLVGIPTPAHCQGRSFRHLLDDPNAGHRYDAYSSYPAWQSVGHSLRFGNYRYTEWHKDTGDEIVARVLTDLSSDPGEVTNVLKDPVHADAAERGAKRLAERINQATGSPRAPPVAKPNVRVDLSRLNIRQNIDGFGGSVAFWATDADDSAIEAALHGLQTNILRVQGEVTKTGRTQHNVDLLKKSLALNPNLQVLLTFWQPRSELQAESSYWLEAVEINSELHYQLKAAREQEWADEIISRVRQYAEWGVRPTHLGVQNESNWSHEGTQTCRWEPERLRKFIEGFLKPGLREAGFGEVKVVAPDLAFVGVAASEFQRFLPVMTSPDVDVMAYHMYDSYNDTMNGALEVLVQNSKAVQRLARENAPGKKLWMTETTGAQWNSDDWHTFGWTSDLTEHQKAIKAARYMHMTLVDAEANAFLWWGLIYSLPPDDVAREEERKKFYDEGLVLVERKWVQGRQPIATLTKKYFVFKQYSAFVEPGFARVALAEMPDLQAAAFVSPHRDRLIVVCINDTPQPQQVQLELPADMKCVEATQTDRDRDCEPVDIQSPLPPESVRTFICSR